MKEQCEHCHNMVVGQFNPSDTRKWLTALAKKGGLKAVLGAAGSVIPGFGNVSGFIAGAAIDVIYGNNINKLVDKVADAFDDNKIYVFTCPNCGHAWNRKEGDVYINEDDDEEEDDGMFTDDFNQFFDNYLEEADEIARNLDATVNFMKEVSNIHNVQGISRYWFLAAFAGLLYLSKNGFNKNIQQKSKYWINKVRNNDSIPQDLLLSHMLDITRSNNPEDLLILMNATKKSWFSDKNALFKSEYMVSLYENIVFFNVVDCKIASEHADLFKHWNIIRGFNGNNYRMYANAELYDYISDNDFDGAESYLLDAVKCGFGIDSVDGDDFFGAKWLECYVAYGDTLVDGDGVNIKQDVKRGLYVLREAAKKAKGETRDSALYSIAVQYETGEHIEKDLEKAHKYYAMISDPKYVERMKETEILLNSIEEDEEQKERETEYLEELKVCFENGEISKGERRLLEKLRIKLDISEERAAELEASLRKPQLTEAEQEYLDEYRECFAESGNISAGERRLLNKLRITLEISESRAKELEKID